MSHSLVPERGQHVARGVIYVYSCPAESADNLEWVLARALGMVVKLTWAPQPLHSEMIQASALWQGTPGTAAARRTCATGGTPVCGRCGTPAWARG